MKTRLLAFILTMIFSTVSEAYVFNLPNKTTLKNEACVLELGKRIITRAAMGSIAFQDAVLTIHDDNGNVITKHFTSIDMEYNKKTSSEFGAFKEEDGRLALIAEKLNDKSLSMEGVFTDLNGKEKVVFNCGILNLE
jgi:hypothetical protein